MKTNQLESEIKALSMIKQQKESMLNGLLAQRTELAYKSKSLILGKHLIVEVSQQNLETFCKRVEALATMAIQNIFERQFEFKIIIEQKRGKTECRSAIFEDGYEYEPKDELGGGMLPILGFVLRLILWSKEYPRKRPVFVLDEPFKGAIGNEDNLLKKTMSTLRTLNNELGIQLIIISHMDELEDFADNTIRVSYQNGQSIIQGDDYV